jgi:hypothetical protein
MAFEDRTAVSQKLTLGEDQANVTQPPAESRALNQGPANESKAFEGQPTPPAGARPLGPQSIRDEIMRLRDAGLSSFPVHLYCDKGGRKTKGGKETKAGKKATYPHTWAQFTSKEAWELYIEGALKDRMADANGVAILTGVSGIYCVDVDVVRTKEMRPGMELWERLIQKHGEPETLMARSGTGGKRLFFKAKSPGLTRTCNFTGLKGGKETFGVDGRGVGGLVFAKPACYRNGQKELLTYEWLNGPPSFESAHRCRRFW